jgi:hypothetical protein
MERHDVLAHAAAFLEGLPDRTVGATIGADELRGRLGGDLPATPTDPVAVIDGLVRDVEGGIVGSTSGRFFGFVIGGALPVALAADWLTSTWDQNGASYACSPAAAVAEEVCGAWLKTLLGLPQAASFAFVTAARWRMRRRSRQRGTSSCRTAASMSSGAASPARHSCAS